MTQSSPSTVPNAAHGAPQRRCYIVRQAKDDRHNWQFIRKLAADHINSNPYRYALTRDGHFVESKLPPAVQADLSSQLQRKLRQPPPDEPKTAMRKEKPTTPPSDGLRTPRKAARKPRQPQPDGLKTAAQAAAKLGCSIKTLDAHVAAGDLRYVIIGKGTKRPRKMFADADINDFIAHQTRTGSPACRSTASRVRRSGTSNFESEVIAFTGQPRPRPGAKPKK